MKARSISTFVIAASALVLGACSDYDNGFTEKQIQFQSDFSEQFGDFDKNQDWNLATRSAVTVVTSTPKKIDIYTEDNGSYTLVGSFENVSGQQKLEFDVPEATEQLVVSDGETALRAVPGGVVNFDEKSSSYSVVQSTRGGEYVNRNQWKREYIVPGNITDAERAAVVAEFSKVHYGAYNAVHIPWTQMFVQQVWKGTDQYYDAFNQATGTASDKMNRLMIWDNSSDKTYDLGYIHVNDFNSGNQTTVGYDDYDTEHAYPMIGLTLMRNLDPSECPTATVLDPDGNEVTWVKQFCYHNSQSNEYQPTYIMKRVTWTEDGVEKSGLYLGFDFWAEKRPDQPANLNMDVERNWVFNDWIIKVSQALDVNVPVTDLEEAKPASWVLAGEDLGGTYDIDYNDVVVLVERVSGQQQIKVTPIAAGGTLASYLFFGQDCIGEIHQLLGADKAVSGAYTLINMGGATSITSFTRTLDVGADFSLSPDISKANNMGGFTIRVLPKGTAAKGRTLEYGDAAFDGATNVSAPTPGMAPYIICVPFTFTRYNTPTVGQKTTSVFAWSGEHTAITRSYTTFSKWVENRDSCTHWYQHPVKSLVVDNSELLRHYCGEQPATMTASETNASGNPNMDVTFYDLIPSTYPVREVPTSTLALKDGVTEICVTQGETIDLMNYFNCSTPNKIYWSGNTDIVSAVEGQNTKVKAANIDGDSYGYKTTNLKVMINVPTGNLEVDVPFYILGKTGYYPKYNENNINGGEITIKKGESATVYAQYGHASGATASASITWNGTGTYVTTNGTQTTITAGSNVGTETVTIVFTPEGHFQQETATFTVKVVENDQSQGGDQQGGGSIYYKTQVVVDGGNWLSESELSNANKSITLSSGSYLWIYSKDQGGNEMHRDNLTATYNGQTYAIGTNMYSWGNAIGFTVSGSGTQTVTLKENNETITITLYVQ